MPATIHRIDLRPDQRTGLVTSAAVTLDHCLRWLPEAEALAVADSALRHGVTPYRLGEVAAAAAGPGAPQARRVAARATALAANPFESVLRSICDSVPGLRVEPQVWVDATARADLVDVRLRLVLEADSFTWHGGRSDLVRDARRYNRMVVDGWVVLRFTYEDVMHRPDGVRAVLVEAVAAARMRSRPASQRR